MDIRLTTHWGIIIAVKSMGGAYINILMSI